jgi:hypothetical protein
MDLVLIPLKSYQPPTADTHAEEGKAASQYYACEEGYSTTTC